MIKPVSFELREYLEEAQRVLNNNGFKVPISELVVLVLENQRFFENILGDQGRPFTAGRLAGFCDQIQQKGK